MITKLNSRDLLRAGEKFVNSPLHKSNYRECNVSRTSKEEQYGARVRTGLPDDFLKKNNSNFLSYNIHL
jgi:hypothetical protein